MRRRSRRNPAVLVAADMVGAVGAAGLLAAVRGAGSLAALVVPVLWIAANTAHRAYDTAAGAAAVNRRVLRSAVVLTALVACVAVTPWGGRDTIRQALLLVLVTAVCSLAARALARLLGAGAPAGAGEDRRVLLVGHAPGGTEIVHTWRNPRTGGGYRVVGACLSEEHEADRMTELGVPVLGGVERVVAAVQATGADLVVLVPGPALGAGALREIAWHLHAAGVDLAVAPILADVSVGRLSTEDAAGLPLLHVREPDLSRVTRVPKEIFDRVVALTLLTLLAPALVTIAVVVRVDSRGPALFRQRRVGRAGRPFTMLKFRTMTRDAEARKAELADRNISDGLLFKMTDDPRVTRVGRFLRRYSVDELPQLLNVLGGSMSLVGPRPPLPEEVAAYDEETGRRLLVKPGLTGLWQVSGRSDLPWDESVRLDVRYVENWSPLLDLRILWRTGAAVVRGTGAY